MNNIVHPVGNIKISIIKKTSDFLSKSILFILSLFIKINKNESDVIISNSFYAPWKQDKNFIYIYDKIFQYTLLDVRRLYTLWKLSEQVKNVKGAVLDVGCLLGGAGFLLSKNNKNGFTYLIDTFNGYVDKEKFYKGNSFNFKDINYVKKKGKELKLNNIKIIKGIFPECAKKIKSLNKIKLCHLDVNTHNSTLSSFEFIRKKMIKNGYIVFDDYGIHGADSIKKIVNKLSRKFEKDFHFINNYQGQCILIKK